MQNELSSEQLKKLENVLIIKTRGFVLCKEKTSLDVRHEDWRNALRIYIASKKLENCSDGTLANYERCVRMLMETLNKPLRNITVNDLRYYLATYQEKRNISLSYLETLRHYISSFFSWLCDENYIDKNPARRLKRVKVPQKNKTAIFGRRRGTSEIRGINGKRSCPDGSIIFYRRKDWGNIIS